MFYKSAGMVLYKRKVLRIRISNSTDTPNMQIDFYFN